MSSQGGTGNRIVFVTGTRADFGKIQPLAASAAEAGFTVAYFVTGMHMLRRYGDTRLEVESQAVGEVFEFVNQKPGDSHDAILAKTMAGFSDWITEYPADLVVIHGDRVEALAVALVCAMQYIACAHVEGGEVSGTIDEVYRHCNSKLCRYHFVSSEDAAKRVQALGEHPDDIFVIGSPELDDHGAPPTVTIDEVREYYDIPFDEYGIVIFHPVTSEAATMGEQAASLFGALESTGRPFVAISPNNDPGSEAIFDVLDKLPVSQFRVLPSMRFAYFSTLMRHASVIVGNSSLGVREAPFLGVPSLDIGTRQQRRASGESISHALPGDTTSIESFVDQEWGRRYAPSTNFGTGGSGARFVEVLSDSQFWDRPKQKAFYEPDGESG